MTDAGKDPEWRLAAEVLRQALEDAQCRSGQAYATLWDIQEARRFCLDTKGVWADARVAWCDAAHVAPEAFRLMAARTFASASV